MKVFVGFILGIAVVIAGLAVFVFSGIYNVSAVAPHWAVTLKILDGARNQSVTHHSKGIVAPTLNDPNMQKAGFDHFHETCRLCHGAPGIDRNEFAQGLYPNPPDLASAELHGEKHDAQMFWIIKNGLKMTGMPAFGKTHTDSEIWDMVSFIDQLPTLQSDQYKAMIKNTDQEDGHHHELEEGAGHEKGTHHHD
jgi:mono/diheme cytochrome c family protein